MRVSASPASSLTIRPSAMTSTRSQRSGSSSGSEDMTRTAMPRAASVRISRWISTRAPTSTPRVGSSRMRTFGCDASHRPMTTFCWLPPLSWPTGVSMLDALIARSRIVRSASALRRRPLDAIGSIGLATIEPRFASPTLKARLLVSTRPSARRSSGTKPNPAFTAAAGLRGAKGFLSTVMVPSRPVRAEQEPGQFAAAGADETAKAEHFAPLQVETDFAHFRRAGEPAHGKHDLAIPM